MNSAYSNFYLVLHAFLIGFAVCRIGAYPCKVSWSKVTVYVSLRLPTTMVLQRINAPIGVLQVVSVWRRVVPVILLGQ